MMENDAEPHTGVVMHPSTYFIAHVAPLSWVIVLHFVQVLNGMPFLTYHIEMMERLRAGELI